MSTIIGYSVVAHHDDGTTQTINKVSANKMAALISEQGGRPASSGGKNYINADGCPEHGAWAVQPAGVSKTTGKSYNAFWKCDGRVDGEFCKNAPSRDWVETHPAGANDASQVATEPTNTPATTAADFDDLPF